MYLNMHVKLFEKTHKICERMTRACKLFPTMVYLGEIMKLILRSLRNTLGKLFVAKIFCIVILTPYFFTDYMGFYNLFYQIHFGKCRKILCQHNAIK